MIHQLPSKDETSLKVDNTLRVTRPHYSSLPRTPPHAKTRATSLSWFVGLSSLDREPLKRAHTDTYEQDDVHKDHEGAGGAESHKQKGDSWRDKKVGLRQLAKSWFQGREVAKARPPKSTEAVNFCHKSMAQKSKTGKHLFSEWFSEDKKEIQSLLKAREKTKADEDSDFAQKERELLNQLIATKLSEPNEGPSSGASMNLMEGSQEHALQPIHTRGIGIGHVSLVRGVPHDNQLATFRSVLLTGVPRCTSLPSLLAQVGGGPLQKIELLNRYNWKPSGFDRKWNDPIQWTETVLKLQFDRPENASRFVDFAKTGAFKVNGAHLTTFQIADSPADKDSKDSVDPATDEYPADEELAQYLNEPENARRVLVLKQPVPNKRRSTSKRRMSYPDPLTNYSSSFDIADVICDFSRFGRIVEVTPVISRKLCFGIQFFDIGSAMAAKHSIEGEIDEDDEFQQTIAKKYADWYVWYGKDPTDKPLICV